MKNKANFNSTKFTATTCGIGGYNVFPPKTKNGTKPNKANLKPISKTQKPNFSAACRVIALGRRRELFSDTRLRQGPHAGVLVYVEDWLAAVNAVAGQRNR